MKVQEPSASTATSRRTITLRRAIRRMPMASATVSATGRPSGMADTARATASKKISPSGIPRISATPAMSKAATPTRMATPWVNFSIRTSRGAFAALLYSTASAMRPSSVSRAVLTTTPRPRPRFTIVPAKAMLIRSPNALSAVNILSESFITATDSPVSRDSSTFRS